MVIESGRDWVCCCCCLTGSPKSVEREETPWIGAIGFDGVLNTPAVAGLGDRVKLNESLGVVGVSTVDDCCERLALLVLFEVPFIVASALFMSSYETAF